MKSKHGGKREGAGAKPTIDGGRGGHIYSFRFGQSHLDALDRYAHAHRITRSEAMRRVIERLKP